MKSKVKSLFLLLPSLLLIASCQNTSSSQPSSSLPGSSNTPSSQSPSTPAPSTPSIEPEPEPEEEFVTAVNSLKRNSHIVNLASTVRVLHPDSPLTADLQTSTDANYTYSYKTLEDGTIERGYHEEGARTNADLIKETGEPDPNATRVYDITPLTIFEDSETGLAYSEVLNIDNSVTTSLPSEYNPETGVYDPIVFENNYRNPWDFISANDLYYGEDGNIHLSLDKAEFLTECYKATSVNWVTDCIVNLNSKGEVATVDFTTPELVGETFTRTSTLRLSYSRFGENVLSHIVPLTNDNPDLATALNCLKDAKNFTYVKTIENVTKKTKTITTAYYDNEAGLAFYHQGEDDALYTAGDNYDYVAARQTSGEFAGKWLGYNYLSGTLGWNWAVIYVSSSYPYVIDTWEDLIPSFDQVSPNVFTEENGVYTPDSSLFKSIGSYFDNGFLGVNSESLETNGDGLSLTVKDGRIDKVEARFGVSGDEYHVTFTLKDIDSTTFPQYFLDSWDAFQGN